MTGSRRLAALGLAALLLIVAAVLIGQRQMTPEVVARPAPASGKGTSRGPGSTAAAVPPGEVADVRLERLHAANGDLSENGRDPFRYRQAPPPPKVVVPPPPVMLGPPVPLPPPPPAPVPPPPPIPLKFVGLVEMAAQAGKVAVLSDSKGSVFYGKEGDIIDGRYRLLRVAADQAELAYTDGRGRQVLRLSGQ